jgi:hypothetical protein
MVMNGNTQMKISCVKLLIFGGERADEGTVSDLGDLRPELLTSCEGLRQKSKHLHIYIELKFCLIQLNQNTTCPKACIAVPYEYATSIRGASIVRVGLDGSYCSTVKYRSESKPRVQLTLGMHLEEPSRS